MTAIYDEIEIEDFEFDADLSSYFYPCPCGDRFQITLVLADLAGGRVESVLRLITFSRLCIIG